MNTQKSTNWQDIYTNQNLGPVTRRCTENTLGRIPKPGGVPKITGSTLAQPEGAQSQGSPNPKFGTLRREL